MKASFRELFEKYIGENISPEEIIELKEYIRDEGNEGLLDTLLAEAFTDQALSEPEDYVLKDVFRQLMERAKDTDRVKDAGEEPADAGEPGSGPVYISRFRTSKWPKYAAAAILLLGLVTTLDYVINHDREQRIRQILSANQRNDVSPGKDHAILTLSGGGQIVLDSSAAGTISNEGGTTVSNSNGRISYKAGSGTRETLYNTVTTARGNQYQLVLPDGTRVWLNAASSVRFPTAFTGPDRRVELTGEGYFSVAKDALHPFIVDFNHTEVEVLGTEFNVMAYSDEQTVKTTLVGGSIKVTDVVTRQSALLKPGQQTQGKSNGLAVVSGVDTDEVIAWKEGLFDFESADLVTILRQVARWYNVDVVYEGPVKDRKFFVLMKRSSTLQTLLGMLQDNGIAYRIEGGKLIVKSN